MTYINPYKLFSGSFLPNWLLERSEISIGAKVVYARLVQHAGEHSEAWPKQETLAAEIGLSDRQVRTYLAELEENHLIEIDQIGFGRANRYRFLSHPWMDGSIRKDSSGLKRKDSSGPSSKRIIENNGSHKETCICVRCLAGNPPLSS